MNRPISGSLRSRSPIAPGSMRISRRARDSHWRKWRPMRAGMVLAMILMGAACGGGSHHVTLPPRATMTSPSQSPTAEASSPQGAVRTAYAAFWDASERAPGMPPDQVRALLKDHSTGSYLDFQLQQIASARANHQEPWGHVVRHIKKITTSGDTATVHDCQDASGAGLADTRTHALIAGTRGPEQRNLVAYLTRGSDGQWRVNALKQFKQGC